MCTVKVTVRTPYTLVLLVMCIMMPETCWDKSLIINIRLVASCWFLSLHPNSQESIYICLPACYQRGCHWTDFHEIWHWRPLWKSVLKIHLWLKSRKNIDHSTWRRAYILSTPATLDLHKSVPYCKMVSGCTTRTRPNITLHIHCLSCFSSAFTLFISVLKTPLALRSADFSD
jgi:hypothetical protein